MLVRWLLMGLLLALVTTHTARLSAAESQKQGMQEELLLLKEETVVTAVRHEQPISRSPSNVYVITDEDIRHSGAPDLPTILRRIPGLEIIQMTGAQFDVAARGDINPAANRMLVLVDGRSIFLDAQGDVFWKAIPVTLPEIKRIEVLKGPASALYGFNAFDGVINIITKSPEEMRGATLQFGGGEFGTITSSAIQAGTFGNLGYRLSLGRDQTNQWRDRNALAFRDHKFELKTEYRLPGESKLMLEGGLVDVNRYDGPIQETVTPAIKFTDGYARIGYERPNFFFRSFWKEFDATALAPFNRGLASFTTAGLPASLRITDPNGNPTQDVTANTYDVEAQHALEFGSSDRLTYGINYRQNTVSSNFSGGFSREERLGLYFQNEWNATKALSIVAGLRNDLHTEIHPTYSPRLAALYTVAPDHTVRIAWSVAYRPPTLFQSHYNALVTTSLFGGGVTTLTPTLGSSDLQPEKIVSYEIGYQGWFLRHRLRVRTDLFYNRITNLITSRTMPSGNAVFVNGAGLAEIYGGEAGVEFLATSWLTGFANYSYEEISQNLGVSPIDTVRRAAPRFKGSAGLRGEWDNGLSSEAALHYVGAATYPVSSVFFSFPPGPPLFAAGVIPPDTRVGSYLLLNLRGGYRFWQQQAAAGYMRDAEVAVSVFNALNDKHKEHPLGDTISSRVMGWLTVRY